jgi:hypothetical protein
MCVTVRKVIRDGLQYYTQLLHYSRTHLMVIKSASSRSPPPPPPLSPLHPPPPPLPPRHPFLLTSIWTFLTGTWLARLLSQALGCGCQSAHLVVPLVSLLLPFSWNAHSRVVTLHHIMVDVPVSSVGRFRRRTKDHTFHVLPHGAL